MLSLRVAHGISKSTLTLSSMNKPVYLDYNATTPVDARVLERMLPYFTEKFGNAASRTHRMGWVAEQAVKTARENVAKFINCSEQEIVFTSGSTEAINLAMKGVWEIYRSKGDHIVTVQTEHKAVLDTCKELESKGAKVTYLPVDREGRIDLNELEASITDKTILVAVMFANNETGLIHPMKKISEIVHEKASLLLCDATQAAGKIPVDVQEEGIDLLCLSAHKVYGPKGVGALYVRRKDPRVTLHPLLHGGGHERGLRSGTLNVPGIVGFGRALEIAEEELWSDAERISKLRTLLEQQLIELGNVYVNGAIRDRLSNVSNLCFMGIKADGLITKLPDLCVSTGSACTSAIPEPSHVLSAMGLKPEQALASVRFSLGKYTTFDEITFTLEAIKNALISLKKD